MFEGLIFFVLIIYLLFYTMGQCLEDGKKRDEAIKNGKETYWDHNNRTRDVRTDKVVIDWRTEDGRRILRDPNTWKEIRDISHTLVEPMKAKARENGLKGCYRAYKGQFPWIYESSLSPIYVDEITGKPFTIDYHPVKTKEEFYANGNNHRITYYRYYDRPVNGEKYSKGYESPFVPGKYTCRGEDLKA